MNKLTLFIGSLLSFNLLFANNAVDDLVLSPIFRDANISLLVREVGEGRVVAEYRSNNHTVPASVTKLLTTATALELYGGDYCMETYLETDGAIDAAGTLHGNIYIHGTGDPTMGSYRLGNRNFLNTWIQQLYKQGIRRIEGRIISDASFFDPEAINVNWIWEDIGNYYAPGISALAYMDNSLNIQLRSGAVGTVAQVTKTFPEIPGLVFENYIRCTAIQCDGAYVHGVPYSNKRYLYGAVPSNRGIFGIKGDIPNPPLLLAQHFTMRLRDAGIEVTEEADYTLQPAASKRRLLYTHRSPELREIVKEINHKSNNHYAEQLFRHIGSRSGIPASVHNSVGIIRSYWKYRIAPYDDYFLCDGSGLSPQNALSAKFLTDLVEYMVVHSAHKEDFIASLPTAGHSGTLASFLCGTSLHGCVHAKSGTTRRVKAYSGLLDAPDGKQYVFTIMINNASCKPSAQQHAIERFLLNVCTKN